MPNLPTFNVEQATADRLLAAFSNQTDEMGLPLTPVQAYRRWLKRALTNIVLDYESEQGRKSLEQDIAG